MVSACRRRSCEGSSRERTKLSPEATKGTEERRPELALTTRSSASRITRKSGDRSMRSASRPCTLRRPPRLSWKHSGAPRVREVYELRVLNLHCRGGFAPRLHGLRQRARHDRSGPVRAVLVTGAG